MLYTLYKIVFQSRRQPFRTNAFSEYFYSAFQWDHCAYSECFLFICSVYLYIILYVHYVCVCVCVCVGVYAYDERMINNERKTSLRFDLAKSNTTASSQNTICEALSVTACAPDSRWRRRSTSAITYAQQNGYDNKISITP